MLLIAADVSSLSTSLSHWELAEYVSEGFVILFCAGELVADLGSRLNERTRKSIERVSTMGLVTALTIGLGCLVRTNQLSGYVIGSLGDKARQADQKAQEAVQDSKAAHNEADAAQKQAGDADKLALDAVDSATRADGAAGKAQKRADAVAKRADQVNEELTKTIEAVRQPTLSKDDLRQITDSLKTCPKRDSAHVLVHSVFSSNLGILIFNALRDAGFEHVDLQSSRTIWEGISTHGSQSDVDVNNCIQGALVKKVTIIGALGFSDPPGSPITIDVGLRPIGELPK